MCWKSAQGIWLHQINTQQIFKLLDNIPQLVASMIHHFTCTSDVNIIKRDPI